MVSGITVQYPSQGVHGNDRGPDRSATSSRASSRTPLLLAALVAAAGGLWLILVLFFQHARFVVFDPEAKTGLEVFLAVGQIFGAFVLAISPLQASSARLRWV